MNAEGVVLVNGSKAPRVYNSEGCTVLPCGCAYTEGVAGMWLQFCRPHWAQLEELRAEARRAHAEQQL